MQNSISEAVSELRRQIELADAIIVGGASGMSAASGFRFYYMDDDTYKKLVGGIREKYDIHGFFDAMYDRRLSAGELYAIWVREARYLYECATGETYEDLAELLDGKNYYIATTNQDAQFYRVFPAEKITRLQGDFRYWQCSRPCHDEIYPNREKVYELEAQIKGDELPEELIPRCPKCGAKMIPWWRSHTFLEGEYYMNEMERYFEFLRANSQKRTLFLELGVGMMTPMFIKEPFMNMVYQWKNAFYATLNPKDAIIPPEIADKALAVKQDIALTLKQLLGKSTAHVKTEAFAPSRAF